jgi:hypothetical protein
MLGMILTTLVAILALSVMFVHETKSKKLKKVKIPVRSNYQHWK